MATNRSDTLDPALLRPGRLDRKIEFPLPDRRQKRLIFSTITARMNLSEEVDLEDCIPPVVKEGERETKRERREGVKERGREGGKESGRKGGRREGGREGRRQKKKGALTESRCRQT